MRLLFITFLILNLFTVEAQEEFSRADYEEFMERYNIAKIHLANHQSDKAITILEELVLQDPSEANINYLLGVCYVKEGTKTKKAVNHLQMAADKFREIYFNSGIGAAQHVYYYLTLAHSYNQDCDLAQEALQEFEKQKFDDDSQYLEDAQQWVKNCREKKRQQANFKDRLVLQGKQHDLDIEEVELTTQSVLWGVQVGALIEPKFTREFENLKNIEVYIDENGVFRYVIGNFVMRSQAAKLLEEVRAKGYNDAFIVDINKKDDKRFKAEVNSVDYEPINFKIRGKIDYKVQIGSFREEIPDHITQLYFELDNIESYQHGDLTQLNVGKFNSYDKADIYKTELVEKGYKGAFVVAFNGFQKISLRQAAEYLSNK